MSSVGKGNIRKILVGRNSADQVTRTSDTVSCTYDNGCHSQHLAVLYVTVEFTLLVVRVRLIYWRVFAWRLISAPYRAGINGNIQHNKRDERLRNALKRVSNPQATQHLRHVPPNPTPTPCSRVLIEELKGSQLVNKFPAFCETRRFSTAFIKPRLLSLSWARSIQSILPSHFLKTHFNIIIQHTPGFSKWSLSLRFSHKNRVCMYVYLLSPHTCYMPSQSHSSRFNYPHNIWWGVQVIMMLVM